MYYTPTSFNYAIAKLNYKTALYYLKEGTIKGYCKAMKQYRISWTNYRNES